MAKQPKVTKQLPNPKAKTTRASIKNTIRANIEEEKENIKIEMALGRENIQQALGVGNFKNWEEAFNKEYESVISIKPKAIIQDKKLKVISKRKAKGIL